jgi:tRNA pseudouridine55 synthase
MPPAFSAKKIGGVASYKMARRRQTVALTPAPVTVTALVLEQFADGLAQLRLTCSAGFYVRSLAHELGEQLRCGAHLAALRRTRAGVFSEAEAVPLDAIESEGRDAAHRLIRGAQLLPHLPAVVLNERGVRRAAHGNAIAQDDCEGTHPLACSLRCRLFDRDGRLLGIAESRAGGLLHPLIVLG